jgi:hypothetical protein
MRKIFIAGLVTTLTTCSATAVSREESAQQYADRTAATAAASAAEQRKAYEAKIEKLRRDNEAVAAVYAEAEAQSRARLEELERTEKREAAKASKATAAKKAACGADYMRVRIGMDVARVQQCVTSMRVTGQIQRADGVLTTYAGGGAFFHVMNGRIVAWGQP